MIQFSIFVDGRQVSDLSEVEGKEISIGRSPGCLIRLPDPSISRLHAAVKYSKHGWILEKKSTYGGLSVNGQEVENAILQGGEEIVIANFVMRVNVTDPGGAKPAGSTGSVSVARDVAVGNPSESEAAPQDFEAGASAAESEGVYTASDSSRTNIARSPAVGYLRFEPGAANVSEYIIKKDHVVVGRASKCDIVILEKKASRKHFEIRREGLSFYLKDFGSANGTYVNGKKVDSVELIPGDVIKVGDISCEFSIENKEFFAKQDQFISVPQAALPAGGISEMALAGDKTKGDLEPLGIPEIDGGKEAVPEAEDLSKEKSLFRKRWKQFQRLPRTTRLIIILGAAVVLPMLFNTEEPKKKGEANKVTRGADGTIIRRFEDLSDKNKQLVKQSYKELLEAREKKEFQKMLDNTTKILRLVTDYRDVKLYETEARKGLEDEEKRAEEEKVRKFQEQIAIEVKLLVEKGEVLYSQAYENPDKRGDLEILIQEIYSKDPNNSIAQSWQMKIKAKIAEEARNKELEEQEKRLKDKAEAEFAKLEALFSRDKYIEALQFAETLTQIGYSKEGFLDRVESKKNEIRGKLSSIIDPLVSAAEQERISNGDLVKAKDNYMKALAIDPENTKANEGLEAIRNVLHLRAKRLYAQAILAESVSSLEEAKVNLQKCLQVAPDKDPYRRRCEAKLAKYEAFTKEEKE